MPQSLKRAPLPGAEVRHSAPSCRATGCTRKTRHAKPYCPGHVELSPYAKHLIAQLEKRDAELERVLHGGPAHVDPHGLTAAEITLHLQLHGSRTVARISIDLQLAKEVVLAYGKALASQGVIALMRHRRGVYLDPLGMTVALFGSSNESAA